MTNLPRSPHREPLAACCRRLKLGSQTPTPDSRLAGLLGLVVLSAWLGWMLSFRPETLILGMVAAGGLAWMVTRGAEPQLGLAVARVPISQTTARPTAYAPSPFVWMASTPPGKGADPPSAAKPAPPAAGQAKVEEDSRTMDAMNRANTVVALNLVTEAYRRGRFTMNDLEAAFDQLPEKYLAAIHFFVGHTPAKQPSKASAPHLGGRSRHTDSGGWWCVCGRQP